MTGLSHEDREEAFRKCAPALNAAADECAERGKVEAAAALRTLAETRDLDLLAARSLLDLESLDPADRDLVINGVWDVARTMIQAGDDWNPGVLAEWLTQVTAIYGFPGDRE